MSAQTERALAEQMAANLLRDHRQLALDWARGRLTLAEFAGQLTQATQARPVLDRWPMCGPPAGHADEAAWAAAQSARAEPDEFAALVCGRCATARFVSVSLNGGVTRRAQCVRCGQIHPDWQAPGSRR